MMNVEHSQAAPAPGRSAEGAHGKSKAQGAGAAADAPGGGDFMSLLMSLGAGDSQEMLDQEPLLTGAESATGTHGSVTDGTAGLAGSPASVTATAALPTATDTLPPWGAAEQMLQWRQTAEGKAAGDEVASALDGVDAQGGGASPAERGLPHRAPFPGEQGLKIGQDGALRDVPGPLGHAVSARMQAAAALRQAQVNAEGNVGGAALSHGIGDPRNSAAARQGDLPRAEMAALAQAAAEVSLATLVAGGVPVERRGEKAADPLARLAQDAVGGGAVPTQGEGTDISAASEGASVGDPGTQVAEQVSYWIANDVENAELRLDRFGDSPVEVSISLHGKEAQVEFRTDLQEMRQVLQDAVTQLKDMLQRQGLVLTGVSVGGSGADAAGQREQQAERQNARQTTVVVPSEAVPAGTARMAHGAGRALDIFV